MPGYEVHLQFEKLLVIRFAQAQTPWDALMAILIAEQEKWDTVLESIEIEERKSHG